MATIICPACLTTTIATMPEGACQFFWDCPACGSVIRPLPGDCCVFCSYSDQRCPTAVDELPQKKKPEPRQS